MDEREFSGLFDNRQGRFHLRDDGGSFLVRVETGNRVCGARLDYGNLLVLFEDTEISSKSVLKRPVVAREWISGQGECDCGQDTCTGQLKVRIREQWPELKWSLEFRAA